MCVCIYIYIYIYIYLFISGHSCTLALSALAASTFWMALPV